MTPKRLRFPSERARRYCKALRRWPMPCVTLGPKSKNACALFADGGRNLAAGARGVDIERGLERALEVPTPQIAANSGADGGVVVRLALKNAVSVAGTLLPHRGHSGRGPSAPRRAGRSDVVSRNGA
jgi:hypothetical protein